MASSTVVGSRQRHDEARPARCLQDLLIMRTVALPLPKFGFVLATRAALAAGLGLLFAEKIPADRRRVVGLALVAFGAVTTIPAVRWISRSFRQQPSMA